MRLRGGFSRSLGLGLRAGVSMRGRPWLGARGGAGGAYVGVTTGGASRGPLAALQDTQAKPVLSFRVEDDGRVFLGDVELELADLRTVVDVATAARARANLAKRGAHS